MIIGYDGSRAFIKDKTGTENYSYQLLQALAKIDKDLLRSRYRDSIALARRTLPFTDVKGKKNQYIIYIRPGVNPGGNWPKNFRFKTINWPRFWTQAGLALQTFKDQIDVLFIPAHTLPIIKKPGLKIVVTVHDLGSEYLPSMHQVKQRLYLSLMQRYQLQTATKIIAVSKATKDDLIKKVGCDPKNIEVIYEGYDKKLFKPIKSDLLVNRLIHCNLQPKTYFLFVGTVQPRKNIERLIKAYARFLEMGSEKWEIDSLMSRSLDIKISNDQYQKYPTSHIKKIKLVIAGSKGWLSDDIYKLPKRLGIEKWVKFLGYVPEKDLPALYSGALALTFPSLFEGFGLPIIEAQACGCPVLTSNISSMSEIAGPTSSRTRLGAGLRGVNKGAILVNPYNVDEIASAMIEVMDEKIRSKLMKAGFENVKRFSWENCGRETLEVLEEAAK